LAEETCDEAVDGTFVEVERRPLLLYFAVVEDDDPLRQRHRLHLIVRDIDHRRFEFVVKPRDFDAHLRAKVGIEVRQRLVEQEDIGRAGNGSADRDALPLATGKLPRLAVEQRLELQRLGRRAHLRLDLGLADPDHLEREAHILSDGHVRIERVGLEHHGNAAVGGRHPVHRLPTDA
jgi:hypothetical protein